MNEVDEKYRCGYVAIVGRPNVGKSTLLNHILGQKISITSRRPQTTRHRILGIKTVDDYQAVYLDTPGLHLGAKKAMNRYLNRAAGDALNDVDIVVFVVDGLKWTEEDQWVLKRLESVSAPVLLAINKIDKIEKEALLAHITSLSAMAEFEAIIPLSARLGENVAALEQEVQSRLPCNAPFFPDDQVTDRSMRFMAAEIVREKLMRRLGQELPYAMTVEIESFEERAGVAHIGAVIWVERRGQKAIVIGKGGENLKEVGKQARLDLQAVMDQKVFLRLWVKVKEGWSADERALRSLGYGDD